MLMANYLQRFLFKWKYTILILLVTGAMGTAFDFQVNRWLTPYSLALANAIGQGYQTKITFETVHYHFPNSIILKNVKIFSPDKKSPMLQASRVTVGVLNNIAIDGMAIDLPALKNYWVWYGNKIYARTKGLPPENIRLLVSNGQFYPHGLANGDPIGFKMDLRLDQGSFSAHGSWGLQSSLDLWGRWHAHSIDWKGFIFYDKFYILDIDGNLNAQGKDIVLKKLTFSLNGDNVTASGHFLRQDFFQCEADVTFKNTRLHFYAHNTRQGLVFKGTFDLQNAHLAFKDLMARIINGHLLKLRIKQMQSNFSIHGNEYRLPLEDLWASIHLVNPDQEDIALSAKIYAGHLHGRIFLNTASVPWQVKGQGQFEGIDMAGHGLLSGKFKLQAPQDMELTGSVALHHGNFNGSDLQQWMAKTLQMPSLGHVSNADISSRFTINGKLKMLDDLKLNTEDFELSGFFHLDADDLVSSRNSLRFSQKLLGESPLGRRLIGLVSGAWTLPFEFSLSGDLHRMNFQWDNSPLKDRVRQHMFGFIERMIDQRVDAYSSYKVTIPNESVSPG